MNTTRNSDLMGSVLFPSGGGFALIAFLGLLAVVVAGCKHKDSPALPDAGPDAGYDTDPGADSGSDTDTGEKHCGTDYFTVAQPC